MVCSRLHGFPAWEMGCVMAGRCLLCWAAPQMCQPFPLSGSWALQVINRAKLERAGKDNLFVKTLYGKDKPVIPQSIEEQQRIGDLHLLILKDSHIHKYRHVPIILLALPKLYRHLGNLLMQ